jgi:GntR family transcriptional regulator
MRLKARLREDFMTNIWPPVAEQIRRLDIDASALIDTIDA